MSERLRVLLVEDNLADVDLIRETLPETGPVAFRVEGVSRLAEAIARVKRGGLDVILLDLGLPDSQGLATFEKLQEAAPGIPTIVLTGNDDEETAVAAVRQGAQDYLIKGQVIGNLLARAARYAVERARTEEALRESERKLKEAQRLGQIGHWDFDPETRSLNWSEMAYAIYERDQTLGPPSVDEEAAYYAPEDASRLRSAAAALMTTGGRYEVEAKLNLPGGRFKHVVAVAEAVSDGRSGIVRLLGTVQDITRRKVAEAALRLQSAALTAAANAIVITDLDGTIEWINAAFSTLTGYRVEEAVGRNPRDLIKSGVHDQAFYQHLWDTILAGDVWSGEMTNRRKDGSLYPEEMTVTPVKDDRGAISHFIAIKRDLTEHHEMEAQLRQAQKMESVGQLAGGVAHDFNNLLTVILTTTDLALGELKDGDPLRADFQEVRQAAERATSLTRQLLAFSRRQLLDPEVLDLNAVLAGMQTMLRRLIRESIALVFAPAQDLGRVRADPGQLEQVLMNLAVNARDAMPEAGTLTIETRNVELDEAYAAGHPAVRPGPYVMLVVGDTGVGMHEATRIRIFEPFFTTKALGKGTGLGLSTVYGIVRQSGGSIDVDSEVGKGTTFKVYLPRVEATAQPSRPAQTATSVGGTETVLIVEDDAALRHMAGRLLRAVGYTVRVAGDAVEALALLQRHAGPVHLMLTDMVMPGMGGRELATALKGLRPQMKVIFTSGYTDDVIRHKGLLEGTAHFIGKPYSAAQLKQKVRDVLDA